MIPGDATLDGGLLSAALTRALRAHPRLVQQEIVGTEVGQRLLVAVPLLVPFRELPPAQVAAVLDWDHRLPSQRVTLRLYLNYDEAAIDRFERAHAERVALIAERNLFPEFDVPDFSELPADESYDVDLSAGLAVEGSRLTSPWRRDIDPELAGQAVALVRATSAFQDLLLAEPARPPQLGDLDPVSWLPPCESGHPRWTIDVWWLTSFDGRVGTGWSFLVDPGDGGQVVAQREFTVRAG